MAEAKWYLFYGVATISRLLKIIGLFCRIWVLLWGYFAKEIYDLMEPTNRSHPIYKNLADMPEANNFVVALIHGIR